MFTPLRNFGDYYCPRNLTRERFSRISLIKYRPIIPICVKYRVRRVYCDIGDSILRSRGVVPDVLSHMRVTFTSSLSSTVEIC